MLNSLLAENWLSTLSPWEHVYFWLAIVASAFLLVQIVLLCFSSFGGDTDIDGDGDIDVDVDSGVSLFAVKGLTAFFAVGGWTGLLVCSMASDSLQWLSIIFSILAGLAAWALVVVAMRAMIKMQCNGALQTEKLVGQHATVYVSVPPARSGRGKVTLNAQGKFTELDAVTDGDRLSVDETVEIVATENECVVVKKSGGNISE